MKVLRIESNKESFYLKYLLYNKALFDLGDSQMKVFAYLLYLNDKYYDLGEIERGILMFNTEVKKELQKRLNISRASLENHFSKLRKKGYIIGRNISPRHEIRYDTHKDLLIQFRISKDEG